MHTTLENYFEVPMYTNREGDDADIGDEVGFATEDGYDGDEDDLPYAKEGLVSMKAAISPRRRRRDNMICPLPEKENTFDTTTRLKKLL